MSDVPDHSHGGLCTAVRHHVREMLSYGEPLPEELVRPEVVQTSDYCQNVNA